MPMMELPSAVGFLAQGQIKIRTGAEADWTSQYLPIIGNLSHRQSKLYYKKRKMEVKIIFLICYNE